MDADKKKAYLLNVLNGIEIDSQNVKERNIKAQILDSERDVKQAIMHKIEAEDEFISSEQKDVDGEIRRTHLAELKLKWLDDLKVTQAKSNKWSRKDYEEKLQAVEHN